jgi:hypothetical protein
VRPSATEEARSLRSCRSHHNAASSSNMIVTPVTAFNASLHILLSHSISTVRGGFERSSSIRTDRELLFDQRRGEQRRDDRRRSEGGGQGRRGGDDNRIPGRAEEKRAGERVPGDRVREDMSRGQDRRRRNERDSDRCRGGREERADRAVRGGRVLESDRASGVRRLLSNRIREESGREEGSQRRRDAGDKRESNRARKPALGSLNGNSDIGFNSTNGHHIRSPNHHSNNHNQNNGNSDSGYSGKGDGGRNFGTDSALSSNGGVTCGKGSPRNGQRSAGDAKNEGSYKSDNNVVQRNHNNGSNLNDMDGGGGGGSKNSYNGNGNHKNYEFKGSNSSNHASNGRRDFEDNERHRSGEVQEQNQMTQQRDRLGTDRPGTFDTSRIPYRPDMDRARDRGGGSQSNGSKSARMNESKHNSNGSSRRGYRGR